MCPLKYVYVKKNNKKMYTFMSRYFAFAENSQLFILTNE